ncbi:NUDIX hydrolase [Cohnella nanjingensis]|uniref:NUDIX domain-containing protein n=1 Tax=Cohnella nanjingensis TaxID=1387779 RepID=A0A7X0RPC8_9BACL|nr:NUDIX domain-containing protein [Cohnella nanjingensis]MBB6670066.1 NUDIX domain-containing protein [Cohnella nanjingensis]
MIKVTRIFTLCIVRDNNKILVQKRHKSPFKGYWNAPGGKVEIQESPKEACIREVMEETGLHLAEIRFRGVMTVSNSIKKFETGVLMLFDSSNFYGELISSDEGEVDWIELDKIYGSKHVPESMMYLLPYIVDYEGIITGKLVYNKHMLEECDISLQA